jgi:hypothetical protein
MGMKKATVALAHRLLTILFRILKHGESYREFGGDYFDRLNPERAARRFMERLDKLGFDVSSVQLKNSPPVHSSVDPVSHLRRGPGRPCKCDERGIPCPHSLREAKTPGPRNKPLPNPVQGCRKCAAWKIPCIHVRPRLKQKNNSAKPEPPQ